MDNAPRFSDSDFQPPDGEPAGPDALKQVQAHVREAAAYAAHLLAAKADATRLQIRRMVIAAGLGLLGLFVGAGMLIAAAVLVLQGAAGGLGEWTQRPWLGELIVGLAVLSLAALAVYLGLARIRASSFRSTKEKYEQRKQEQRREFGHDVADAAKSAH
jgi:uncharacterized membrane protein YjgN (DUF898 family)